MKRTILFLSILLVNCLAFAQAENSSFSQLKEYAVNVLKFNREYPQEKVYVHMDNRSYFIGDTI